MPGSTPATSQLDWLSSTTAMIVLSWSKAKRDLLKSFSWGIRGTPSVICQRRWCHLLRRLPHTISPLEGDGFEPSVRAKFFGCPVDPPAIHLPQYKPAPSRQGPMVRIHLSSGESTNHRFLPDFIPLGSGGKRLEMLCQPEGATVDEVASVTGWQRHTVRGVFSGSLRGYRCAQ